MRIDRLAMFAVIAMLAETSCNGPRARFERVLALQPDQGVFAYARISPSGRYLVYAAESRDTTSGHGGLQTVTVFDFDRRQIVFTEPGIDAYWSPDGSRVIYQSFRPLPPSVTIRNVESGIVTRDVVPINAGDYYSWAERDGQDIVLTITSHYFTLDRERARLPLSLIPPCPAIGVGERPLLSHDGRRVTTFVGGTIVVRDLTDCANVFDTGFQGAKADFSWDGRYIAFHAPKTHGPGYDIYVVDLRAHTVRTVTHFAGSSLFPSWTRDGRLCFRYDGDDFRGFIIASNVLSEPERPLPANPARTSARRKWSDIFPETTIPAESVVVAIVWATWSAHSPFALSQMQRARDELSRLGVHVAFVTAVDPGSEPADVDRLLRRHGVTVPLIPLAPQRLSLTEGENQVPSVLLFRSGWLLDRKLGAQSSASLEEWILAARDAAR